MFCASGVIPASDKLGSLPEWDWIIDRSPLQALIILTLISPIGIMYVLRPVVEGRVVRLRDEFLTFKMDIMLAIAFCCGRVLVGAMGNHAYIHRGVMATVVQLGVVLLWVAVGALHMWQERQHYSNSQRLSPTAIYHNGFLYVFLGYSLTVVCGMGLVFAPWSLRYLIVRLGLVAAVAAWFLAWPLWDSDHKTNPDGEAKFLFAHVADGWPWQHRYRYLGGDLAQVWADLKELPEGLKRLYWRL